MTFIEPLDLYNLLVNTFSGSLTIFLFISLIFITILAASFRMNMIAMLMLIGLFGIFMATWIPWFYVFIIIIVGLGIAFSASKLIKN